MKDIEYLRQNINEIDDNIIELLAKRHQICLDIADYKFQMGKPVSDRTRERAHLDDLMQKAASKQVSSELVRHIFSDIFIDSVALQNSRTYVLADTNPEQFKGILNISCLGPDGSYSYLATMKYFRAVQNKISIHSCSGFREIIESVENGKTIFGVMPIENTSSGYINDVYDLLQDTTVKIVGELSFNIEHCILTYGDTDLKSIHTIFTHPQPASQCSLWLHDNLPNAEIKTTTASSAAIRQVAKLKDPTCAAIGCAETGNMFGLQTAITGIANQARNVTRFIVVSLRSMQVPNYLRAKTSITFTTTNRPGALAKVLDIFSRHNINMDKLQSRPRSQSAGNNSIWAKTFYADICINTATPLFQNILLDLKEVTGSVKVLGCFPMENSEISENIEVPGQ